MVVLVILGLFSLQIWCQDKLPLCPANPISGVPLAAAGKFVGQPVCICGGSASRGEYGGLLPESIVCSNGGSCIGGECTLQTCPSGVATTSNCNCSYDKCYPGGTCSSSGSCTYSVCPTGSRASGFCQCKNAAGNSDRVCGPGETCEEQNGYPFCRLPLPKCANQDVVLSSACYCNSFMDCYVGEACSSSGNNDCYTPTCPNSNTPVASYCTCPYNYTPLQTSSSSPRCWIEKSDICLDGLCVPSCPTTGVTNYSCGCGSELCVIDQTCTSGSCSHSICAGDGVPEKRTCMCGGTECSVGSVCDPSDGTCACGDNTCFADEECIIDGLYCSSRNLWDYSRDCTPFGSTATCKCGSNWCVPGQECDYSTRTCTTAIPACSFGVAATATCRCFSPYFSSTLAPASFGVCSVGEACNSTGTCFVVPNCSVGVAAKDLCKCSSVTCAVGDTCNKDGICDSPSQRTQAEDPASSVVVPTLLVAILVFAFVL